jgi:hypothetical protein
MSEKNMTSEGDDLVSFEKREVENTKQDEKKQN